MHSEELDLPFFSNWMEYDSGDIFPFDFEQNGIPFPDTHREIFSKSY